MFQGVEEIEKAVASLEAALAVSDRRQAEEELRMQSMRAEVDALRSVQKTVAMRLDAAIARLKTVIGD